MANGALSKLPPITLTKKAGLTFLKAQAVKAAPIPTHSVLELNKVQKETANFLTGQQAADWLGISVYTLARIRKDGGIGYCEIGSGIKFTFEQLETYVASKSKAPCQKTDLKSGNTTFLSTATPPSGKQHGMTTMPDKHAAYLLDKRLSRSKSSSCRVRHKTLHTPKLQARRYAAGDRPCPLLGATRQQDRFPRSSTIWAGFVDRVLGTGDNR